MAEFSPILTPGLHPKNFWILAIFGPTWSGIFLMLNTKFLLWPRILVKKKFSNPKLIFLKNRFRSMKNKLSLIHVTKYRYTTFKCPCFRLFYRLWLYHSTFLTINSNSSSGASNQAKIATINFCSWIEVFETPFIKKNR